MMGIPFNLLGQDLRNYEGSYQLGKYKGQASFSFRLQDNDTIFQGPFVMQKANLEDLLEQEDFSFLFKGNFEDGVAEGDWKFRLAEFKTERESQLIDYQYRISVSGVQEEANGSINQGQPHGQWAYSVDSIIKSEKAKNLFKSSIEFEEGVPQKSFRIEKNGYTLVGRTLRNGLAHDQWSLFSNDGMGALENWYFESGVLKKIELLSEDRSSTLDIYPEAIVNGQTIDLNEGYLNVLFIKIADQRSQNQIRQGLYSLISANAAYYSKVKDILSDLGSNDFSVSFKVIVEEYPVSNQDIIYLDSISNTIKRAKVISESILNNTHLNIEKLSDTETSFLYQVVEYFSSEYVIPISTLIQYHELQLLDAVPREEVITYLWPEELPSREILINLGQEGSTRTFSGPDANEFDFSGRNLFAINQMAQYAGSSLESIQELLGTQLNIEKQQQELVQIEDELYKLSTRIEKLVDSLKQSTSGSNSEALEAIKQFSADNLSAFSAIEDKEERLASGTSLLTCLKQMEPLAESLGALPKQWEEIQQLYKDDIWNPHVAVIMEEEVKKRIKTSYKKKVVPALQERVKADLSCDNAGVYTSILNSLYKRMLELREEDTRKLERKLKRENDPGEILELFNVEPNYPD